MTAHAWLTLLTCTGELAIAGAAIAQGATSPLGGSLALLSLDLFAWNFASLAYELSQRPLWRWMDLACSPLTVPLLLRFVLAFTGRRRSSRGLMRSAFAVFGALSATSVLALFVPAAAGFPGSAAWAICFLVGLVPCFALMVLLLVRHRASAVGEERARAELIFLAVGAGVAIASTELWNELGVPVPPLGNLGTLCGNALLFVAAGRFHLLGTRVPRRVLALSALLAACAVASYLAVFLVFGTQTAWRLVATLTVAVALVGFARVTLVRQAVARERLEMLATIGRFSAQLAHDLKNPLAAVKGAAQFLQAEKIAGRPLEPHANFIALIEQQVVRLEGVIAHYQRLGRVEPVRVPLDANAIVRQVLSLQGFAAAGLEVREELSELPTVAADRDLIANAVENLLRNAAEAMPQGGTLTVRTVRTQLAEAEAVEIAVADTGTGMDSRTRERAFDDFFTTKASGSGLGLAFVRRVIEAHGGRISLTSQLGKGTEVRLQLPAQKV